MNVHRIVASLVVIVLATKMPLTMLKMNAVTIATVKKWNGCVLYYECRKDCYGYSDDCNCPCHQDALESQCCAESAAEAMAAELAALEGNSEEERSSSDEQSK